MTLDLQGNPLLCASATAAQSFDAALRSYATYHGDPIKLIDQGLQDSPDCAMLWLARAWLHALATEPGATQIARTHLAHVATLPQGPRETAHAEALAHLLNGNWTEAGIRLEQHTALMPHDLLAVQSGHLIDFFSAASRSLRDRMARVLPLWTDVPGASWVMGMAAFGLEETGDYARAEAYGREAVRLDPKDSWAHHAVAHVMEMMGRPQDGLQWMAERKPYWASEDDGLQTHNWWHLALCHLESDDLEGALALYDGPIRGKGKAYTLALADASALLWRLDLSGADIGNRWEELSTKWQAQSDPGSYAFNDLHEAMAHLGAGRADLAEKLLNAPRNTTEAGLWMERFGRPLIEGFIAFKRRDFGLAADRLMAARHIQGGFGGSHAQRDVIDWTLQEVALQGKMSGLSEALALERLALRPHSPVNQGFLRRAVQLKRGPVT